MLTTATQLNIGTCSVVGTVFFGPFAMMMYVFAIPVASPSLYDLPKLIADPLCKEACAEASHGCSDMGVFPICYASSYHTHSSRIGTQ
jgi:hypothetical protein